MEAFTNKAFENRIIEEVGETEYDIYPDIQYLHLH